MNVSKCASLQNDATPVLNLWIPESQKSFGLQKTDGDAWIYDGKSLHIWRCR